MLETCDKLVKRADQTDTEVKLGISGRRGNVSMKPSHSFKNDSARKPCFVSPHLPILEEAGGIKQCSC